MKKTKGNHSIRDHRASQGNQHEMKDIFEGKILSRKGRGKPRKQYLDGIKSMTGSGRFEDSKIAAEHRSQWLHDKDMYKTYMDRRTTQLISCRFH